jgi:hypothetical protein
LGFKVQDRDIWRRGGLQAAFCGKPEGFPYDDFPTLVSHTLIEVGLGKGKNLILNGQEVPCSAPTEHSDLLMVYRFSAAIDQGR